MKPEKMTVLEVFQRERRLCVPLFQRAYVWERELQWQPLWDDIRRQAEMHLAGGDQRTHFLGAVVIALATIQGRSVARADVIDGQQRLTTMQLFLAALRDVAGERDADPDDIDVLGRHTANPVRDKASPESLKVWPTNVDREAFAATMRAGRPAEVLGDRSPADLPAIAQAYLFFHQAVGEWVDEAGEASTPADRIFALRQALQSSLQLVVIELEPGDDPQMIFETLNARGQPLLPSDLIRNFVFMRAVGRSEAEIERLYGEHWSHFDEVVEDQHGREQRFWHQDERQGRLVRPRIDLFFFHYLTMKTERDIRIGHLFEEFRFWWSGEDGDVEAFLVDLRRYASLYRSIVVPRGDDPMSILAMRLASLDTNTVHPLLLFLAGLDRKRLLDADRAAIAADLESYLVRRFVCNLGGKNYNRFFLSLLTKAKAAAVAGENLVQTIRSELLRSQERSAVWPDDAAFLRGWLGTSVYVASRSDRAAMLLGALNDAMATSRNERLVSTGLTVEHLLPQRGTPQDHPFAPFAEGGEHASPEDRRRNVVHTIGNLTLLTGPLNSSISNGPFAAKRTAIVQDSDARLNAWMRTDARSSWNEDDVVSRGRTLFETATAIWRAPPGSLIGN